MKTTHTQPKEGSKPLITGIKPAALDNLGHSNMSNGQRFREKVAKKETPFFCQKPRRYEIRIRIIY
jgi:hypothetical protein